MWRNINLQKRYCVILPFCLILLVFPHFDQSEAAEDTQTQNETSQSQRDREFEARVEGKLKSISEQAVPHFQRATAAFDSANYKDARIGFEKALQLAPDFPDALRRLGYVFAAQGDSVEAEVKFRRALAVDRNKENLTALTRFLIGLYNSQKQQEAGVLAKEAMNMDANDLLVLFTSAHIGFVLNDKTLWQPAINRLKSIAPDDISTHYFLAVSAIYEQNWDLAEQEIRLAKKLGLPLEKADRLSAVIDQNRSKSLPIIKTIGYSALIWAGGMVLLLLIGFLLSKITLMTLKTSQGHIRTLIGAGEQIVRRIYRIVIGFTSIYYYISIPFVLILVIGAAAAIGYAFLYLGQIPIKLALMIFIGVLFTIYAMVRSIFARRQKSLPGESVSEADAPKLWSLLREVAQKVDTRPIDSVYLTPGTEVAVMERGSIMEKLRGMAERCLILGIGVLKGMTQRQLSAILAHEYGHFAHKDTAGGNLSLQVSTSIHEAALGLAYNNLAKWYNPAWLFINGFYLIFLRVTLGASRLQEFLADRYAAINYGAKAFADGLVHVIKRSIEFESLANNELGKSFEENRKPENLYKLAPESDGKAVKDMDKLLEEEMNRSMGVYDSHPPIKDRIQNVSLLDSENVEPALERDAWELLPNRASLEDSMTTKIYNNVLAEIEYRKAIEAKMAEQD